LEPPPIFFAKVGPQDGGAKRFHVDLFGVPPEREGYSLLFRPLWHLEPKAKIGIAIWIVEEVHSIRDIPLLVPSGVPQCVRLFLTFAHSR